MAPAHALAPAEKHDGSALRIGIIHARWNDKIVASLVEGTKKALLESGVQEKNIVLRTVPGSWELPIGVQRLYAASQVQSSTSAIQGAGDLLGGSAGAPPPPALEVSRPFDAIIAIGVLIKGETMHFEYIAQSTSDGLMRVGLDIGIPVIFGVLTVLNEEQAHARSGLGEKSHNHGEDWGKAAVEMGVKKAGWMRGDI